MTATMGHRGQPAEAAPDTQELDGFLGYRIKRAWHVVDRDLQRVLRPFGLGKASFSALLILRDNPGLHQVQLARALAIKGPNMVSIVNGLEGKGLIRRSAAVSDRRAHALSATQRGTALINRAQSAVQSHEQRIYGHLSDSDIATLHRALQSICAMTGESDI